MTALAAVVTLLLLTFYGYFTLRKYNAYRYGIHAGAAFIVKIDADMLCRSLVMDYLSKPSYYRRKRADPIKSGLSIPAHVFIYTVRSKSFQTYFCTLPVADTFALKTFIKQRLGIDRLEKEDGYVRGTSANGQLTVAFNASTFVAGYALKKENVNDILSDLLNRKNLLADDDHRILKLKALNNHLAYVFEAYTGTGEFKDGLLHFSGNFNFKALHVKGKMFSHRVFDKNAAVKAWLNAGVNLNRRYAGTKIKGYNIYPDSLLKYYDGYADLELATPVAQADTVVSYTYNDNFEKEETLTPRMVKVPGLNSVVNVNAEAFLNYLSNEGVVKKGMVNKELFPLYNLYVKGRPAALMLSTQPDPVFSIVRQSTPYFFYFEADLNKLKAQGKFPLPEKHFKSLNRLVLKAMNEEPHRQHFEMDLYFRIKDVNALVQLL